MEFHRREDKASWWEYFRLLDLEKNDLTDERRAIAGLEHVETLDPKAAPLERYRFFPQELDARPGDNVYGLDGSDVSALAHLLDGADTMPAHKGLFLAETHRLHPDIAMFTSEIYYEGRVESLAGLERQAIVARGHAASDLAGSGLLYVPVSHEGNQARSLEEVECIRSLVDALLEHSSWCNRDGEVTPLITDDILVVAPYNAQVSTLAEALPELSDRIGTVDRFQGQEAPVVIYSMTSSSPEDAPRGMEFLYNRFRFNVATSRARALCILVGSAALFQPECRTPHQMRMANGLSRFRELSRTASIP